MKLWPIACSVSPYTVKTEKSAVEILTTSGFII